MPQAAIFRKGGSDLSSDPEGIRCMLMRGGSSKGAFFLASDLPADPSERDSLLLRIMGSPDSRQIDGVGGAHPLTTKVAVVSPSDHDEIDIEYLFLQVSVDRPEVSDQQNCGNMLAAVGPFALERGLISATEGRTSARILMKNTGALATASFPVEAGRPTYAGDTEISGVPGGAAEIRIEFENIAGSSTGSLLPTGREIDRVEDIEVTLVDNGMPVVVLRSSDMGASGYESCEELEANSDLTRALEQIRITAGKLMNLGDVSSATVPKLTMISPSRFGGAISTRTFIPHRCHHAIGVLGAVSVATACLLPGSPAAALSRLAPGAEVVQIEHPSGTFEAWVRLDGDGSPGRAGIIRTARKLMDGLVFPRSY